jgi:GT2 family glycosyltransferase
MQISIILINFNSSEYTINCVKSIIEAISGNLIFEIIIIDNSSIENELIYLKKELKFISFRNITLIESNKNLGFAGGNMLGVKSAKGKYFVFVNNDTLFYEDSFSLLYTYMENNPTVAVSTCLSKNKEGEDFCSFDHFIGLRKLIFGRWVLELIFNKPKRKNRIYDSPIEVDAVQGCFMFFRKDIFLEVGGFDTNLFLYYEEIDVCKRIKDKGYKSIYYPNTYFTHFQGASTKNSLSKKGEILISFLYILKKDFGTCRYNIISIYLFIKYFLKSVFNSKYKILVKIIYSEDKFKYSLRNQNK